MPSPEQIIRAQRDEIETLREENRQLREALAPRIVVPRSWRLKTMEERLLRALRSAGPNALCEMRALHALYAEREETPDRGALYALICHLRRKLGEARTGIQIETLRDRGLLFVHQTKFPPDLTMQLHCFAEDLAHVAAAGPTHAEVAGGAFALILIEDDVDDLDGISSRHCSQAFENDRFRVGFGLGFASHAASEVRQLQVVGISRLATIAAG